MAGPWEKYAAQPEDGPWTKYGGKAEAAPAVDEVQALADSRKQTTANQVGGAVRGLGGLVTTVMTPYDLMAGNTKSIGNPERRKAMDDGLTSLIGSDPSSGWYQGMKTAAEVVPTLGIGGLLAKAATAAGASPAIVSALSSSGFTTGRQVAPGLAARAADISLRAFAGGGVGGISAGVVDPGSIGAGAAVGAVLPGLLQAGGAIGSSVAGAFKAPQTRAAERMASAFDADPAALAAQLNRAVTLVPGSKPTAAQILRTPQASVLERVVSESPGGAALKQRYLDQNAARLAAVDRVAPVDPRGLRSSQDDFGTAALNAIRSGDKAAKAQTKAAYDAVPMEDTSIYVPDLAPIRDKFYPAGAFGPRGAVDEAVNTARQIGTVEVSGIKATTAGKDPMTLAQAVRKAGGLSINNHSGVRGELAGLRGDVKNLVRSNGGQSPARMAEAMHEAGYLPDNQTTTLLNALRDDAGGAYSASNYSDPSRMWRAQAEAAMGDAPGAQAVPKKVTLANVDALRKSVNNAQRAAARDPERATEALALDKMRQSIDDRINEVVRGDGAIDEVLPLDVADMLTKAQGLKRAQVEKYRTGPQAAAFRRGADGLPATQGGEFVGKVWGNRAGIANDIQQFRKVLDEQPQVLGQFRSMVTTEGAGTATDGGKLTGKFVRWVENSLPGLRASFDPEQVRMLERIASDIKRSNVAVAAGSAQGSNTYQNASNALSLGLLDSPLLNAAANRVPVVNTVSGPAMQWMRETARERMAKELAALLADPTKAGNALAQLSRRQSPNPLIGTNLLRAAPALVADR